MKNTGIGMIPYSPTAVAALRNEMRLYGVTVSQTEAWTLLRHVSNKGGDRALCVDALLMRPRPKWLEDIVGPIMKEEQIESA